MVGEVLQKKILLFSKNKISLIKRCFAWGGEGHKYILRISQLIYMSGGGASLGCV